MAELFLGVGSNVEPEANLRLAIRELRRYFGDLQMSAVYRNEAVGFDGDDFLNLVVRAETDKSTIEVCEVLDAIHDVAGRKKGPKKYVARELDIDLLMYDALDMNDPPVRVPREDILKYSFVMVPLAELAPDLRHPQTGRTIAEHLAEFDVSQHPLTKESLDLDLPAD